MAKVTDKAKTISSPSDERPQCGLVMPISALDGCSEQHWLDVRNILEESLKNAGFQARLVSEAADVGVIHRRIIQNLYSNPIVVCDVSGTNPNVMFELGMRLTFDKPTVIIKDDKTNYSFDTSPMEHLVYPRDLNYARINKFKDELGDKVKMTLEKEKQSGPQYSAFLKHFGPFLVPKKLETTEGAKDELILQELAELRRLVLRREKVVRLVAKDGALLQGSGPPVFLIERGIRRWIPNERTFERMGFDWGAITQVSDDELETIPRGEDLPSL